jgi:hypothetical protein
MFAHDHLSHALCPFCFGYFLNRVSPLMPGFAWIVILVFMLLCVAGMTGMHHNAQLLMGLELQSSGFLPHEQLELF